LQELTMMRASRFAATAVLLSGLGLGLVACADEGGDLAYAPYPYDDGYYDDGYYDDGFYDGGNLAFFGDDFHHHDFRFHHHPGRFGHGPGGLHHMGRAGGFHGGFGHGMGGHPGGGFGGGFRGGFGGGHR